jgi:hypothetical protein
MQLIDCCNEGRKTMKLTRILVIISGMLMAVLLMAACTSKSMTVKFTENGCTYDGPSSISYGKFTVNWSVNDQKHNKTVLLIVTLADGKTIDDLKALHSAEAPQWVTVLWNDEKDAFGSELEKVRQYQFEHALNTLDSYQIQPLYLICGNEEGGTNPLGPIQVTK